MYVTIDFTNTSGSTCTMFGYPGVSLVTGPPYQQLGVPAKRTTTTRAKVVALAPGATANAVLQIVDALNFPSPSCQPAKATALKVYPPNQFTAVYLPDTSYGCGNPVQTMYIAPVRLCGYGVDAAFMSFYMHGWDIHALRSGTAGTRETEVTLAAACCRTATTG